MPRKRSQLMRTVEDGRIVPEVVQRQWDQRSEMLGDIGRAEDDMLNALAPSTLEGIAAVQGRAERIRKAALRDFALIVWDRGVQFLA